MRKEQIKMKDDGYSRGCYWYEYWDDFDCTEQAEDRKEIEYEGSFENSEKF